ncbi:MAG TPA: DegQ family serine endoprotease [Pontiella sp.]
MRCIKIAAVGVILALMGEISSVRAGVLQETGHAFSEISKRALPAVVFIDVESMIEVQPRRFRHPLEEFFGQSPWGFQLPDDSRSQKFQQQGQGSGFIISKDGYILTNNHVVNDADKIRVTLGDGRKYDAKLIGTDPKSEVALIKIEDGGELPFLELGDSDELEVGEWVLAAGNPFGLSQTITAGVVSAKGRDEVGIAEFGNFIQTDAAINPGNSGGPLLNINGEVVGINTAIYTRTGGYMGIGFAIPINQAENIKDQLIRHGKVSRSVLGIFIQEVDDELAASFGLEEFGGILISQVVEDSAAEEAGLQEGDIIVEMDSRPVGRIGAFRNKVAATPPNSKVVLRIFRDGKYKTISAITKELEGTEGKESSNDNPKIHEKLGIIIDELDSRTAHQMGISDDEGVLISEVEPGGAAWRAGLKVGQVITSVNRQPVGCVRDFKRALSDLEGAKVLLLVSDGRSSRFVVVNMD